MVSNANLHNAKRAQNDEFYTRIVDIENELQYYTEHFKSATILCNTDNPKQSEFWRFFHQRFHVLKLKRIIATHIEQTGKSYAMIYDGSSDDNDIESGIVIPLKGNGDFRSDECVEYLKEADIVVTNPPFSLFRDFISLMTKYNKNFIVIGNMNAITYKEVFPLIAQNKLWLGCTMFNRDMYFYVPDGYEYKDTYKYERFMDGAAVCRIASCCWFTNLNYTLNKNDIVLSYTYSPDKYNQYDNYPAINVDKVAEIPVDYYGVMGVPITFLDKYNPNMFEIIGHEHDINGNGGDGIPEGQFIVNGKGVYKRILIRRKNK